MTKIYFSCHFHCSPPRFSGQNQYGDTNQKVERLVSANNQNYLPDLAIHSNKTALCNATVYSLT